MLENLQYLSIIIEAFIAIIGLIIVFKNKKNYGFAIFLTFAIYVFYDFIKLNNYSVNTDILTISFLVASISMLFVVCILLKENFKNQSNRTGRKK